jgi:C1A family cysteine protease
VRIRLAASAILTVTLAAIAGTTALAPASAEGDPPQSSTCPVSTASESAGDTGALLASRTLTDTVDDAVPSAPQLWSGESESDGWIPEGTSLSDLSLGEESYCLGVPLEVQDWEQEQADQRGARLAASYDYPSRIDWRDVDGKDWTTPIRHQGACGSCVAFGTTAAIESRLEIAKGDAELNPDLSEAHLFFCGSDASCQTGWYPSAAMDFARATGIVDENCYPYSDQDQTCSPCRDWESRVVRLEDWVGLTDPADMKQSLADQGPFEATMLVYVDFYYYTDGVYEHDWGRLLGAHAVTVVGYDDDEGYWIVKNCWGENFGEDGWFRIAYGDSGIDDYVYVPIVEQPSPSYHLYPGVTPMGSGTIVPEPLACVVDSCEAGTELVLTALPEEGYEFVGWSGEVSGGAESIQIVMDSDKVVTAEFTQSSEADDFRCFLPFLAR